jgi:hypothetical protein
MHKNQVEADKRYREKSKERGLARVSVLVPVDKVEELKALAVKWRNK